MSWTRRRKRRVEFERRQIHTLKRSKFQNPLFPKKETRGFFNGRGQFYVGFFLIGLIYFSFFSGYFEITSVSISGLHYLNDQEIRQVVDQFTQSRKFLVLPQNNLLLTDTENLKKEINDSLQERFALNSLNVDKDYPSSLSVNISERIPSLAWVTNNIIYYLDLSGKATRRLEEDEEIDTNFPKVYDLANQEISLNDQAVNSDMVKFVFEATEQLNSKLLEKAESFHYQEVDLPDIWLRAESGWRIHLDSQQEVAKQIDDAVLIITEYFSDNTGNLDYIDVRLVDRVYYKTKY
ncbi:MAG: hypothetical protein ABIB97_01405 [Patescibacteria group bacterium]